MTPLVKKLDETALDRLAAAQAPHGPTIVRSGGEADWTPESVRPHAQQLEQHLEDWRDAPGAALGETAGIQTKHVVGVGDQRWLLKPYFESRWPAVPEQPSYTEGITAERRVPGMPAMPARGAPLTGWAEMTNQALYHAGEIGHLHQQVHVVHERHRGQRQPLVAIRMSPEHQELHRFPFPKDEERVPSTPDPRWGKFGMMPRPEFSEKQKTTLAQAAADARRIAVMDWLSQNTDRHRKNVMITPSHQLLAIDHGLGFDYRPDVSGRMTPHEHLVTTALQDLHQRGHQPEHVADTMAWWRARSAAIRRTFERRLELIKHPALRQHLETNFRARADALDRAAAADDPEAFWAADAPPRLTPGIPG